MIHPTLALKLSALALSEEEVTDLEQNHIVIKATIETDKVRPVCVSGVVGNREIPKPTVGGAARVDPEVQCA